MAAEVEGQNGTMEEPHKVQKRQRDRIRDQGSAMIYLKAIQGILGKSMPKRKGEAAPQAKPHIAERPRRGEGPAGSGSVAAPQKERESTPEVRAEEEDAVLEKSSFCDRRVVIDPQERPSEEPLRGRRVLTEECSPPLEFLDDSDSHLNGQKVSRAQVQRGVVSFVKCPGLFSLIIKYYSFSAVLNLPRASGNKLIVLLYHAFQTY